MKQSRFQFEYRDNASKLHRTVGDILRSSNLFQDYEIYQEYPVSRVNELYPNNSHHFDWVIIDLKIVIECHGRQHYQVTDFSGKSEDGGVSSFKQSKRRDNKKKDAALEAGWTYIEIPYTDIDKISENYIYTLYKANQNVTHQLETRRVHIRTPKPLDKRKEQARQWRKDQYKRNKERLSAIKRTTTKDNA